MKVFKQENLEKSFRISVLKMELSYKNIGIGDWKTSEGETTRGL